jgi:hypothetical protein
VMCQGSFEMGSRWRVACGRAPRDAAAFLVACMHELSADVSTLQYSSGADRSEAGSRLILCICAKQIHGACYTRGLICQPLQSWIEKPVENRSVFSKLAGESRNFNFFCFLKNNLSILVPVYWQYRPISVNFKHSRPTNLPVLVPVNL